MSHHALWHKFSCSQHINLLFVPLISDIKFLLPCLVTEGEPSVHPVMLWDDPPSPTPNPIPPSKVFKVTASHQGTSPNSWTSPAIFGQLSRPQYKLLNDFVFRKSSLHFTNDVQVKLRVKESNCTLNVSTYKFVWCHFAVYFVSE